MLKPTLANTMERNDTTGLRGYLRLSDENRHLEEANEKLRSSNELKDQLLSIISHDSRAPLDSIKSFLQLLGDTRISEHEFQELVGSLIHQIDELKKFLDAMVQWSRSQAARLQPRTELVVIQHLIEETVEMLKLSILGKNAHVHIDVPADIAIFADAEMVKIVLRNLVSNAIKFVDEGAHIFISASEMEHMVRVSVRDTGSGIRTENLDKLFDLIHASTKGTRGELGTGLGLSLCREFVERMGGEIFVTSAIGKGSTFEFTLPRASESQNEVADKALVVNK